jgi:hypothetical protein
VRDLEVNLIASVIAAAAGLLVQWLLRHRRAVRKREFFGVVPGSTAELFVARHASSPNRMSVHRSDVAALVELATVIRECDGLPELMAADEPHRESGRGAEFCVGGPDTNPRTAAHLRASLPGMRLVRRDGVTERTWVIGAEEYPCRRGTEEYVVLVRLRHSDAASPTFLLVGQVAVANLAGARYLSAHYRQLRRRYGVRDDFALLLRVKESDTFGPDHVELVGDRTAEARTRPTGEPVAPAEEAGEGTGPAVHR